MVPLANSVAPVGVVPLANPVAPGSARPLLRFAVALEAAG